MEIVKLLFILMFPNLTYILAFLLAWAWVALYDRVKGN